MLRLSRRRMFDRERFDRARLSVLSDGDGVSRSGIGRLSEKTMHRVVRLYIEPDISRHELRVGDMIADVLCGTEVYEVQTRSFERLENKYRALPDGYSMTAVLPLPRTKRISVIDPDTGEISAPRKSPKTGQFYDAFAELYRARALIGKPGFRVMLLLIDMTEYRYVSRVKNRYGKFGYIRCDRVPVSLEGELMLERSGDYSSLIPRELPEDFTVRDFSAACRLTRKMSYRAVKVLEYAGAVRRVGKQGRELIFSRVSPSDGGAAPE